MDVTEERVRFSSGDGNIDGGDARDGAMLLNPSLAPEWGFENLERGGGDYWDRLERAGARISEEAVGD